MPTYHVDLTTERGLQRVPFTLDDDRPISAQLTHILEELRQRNLVVRGGPDDELIVAWNGREIDGSRTPQALGLNPMYPLELRMRRRAAAAAARREPAPSPFLPKAGYLGPVAGLTGAGLAWIATAILFTDLGDVLASYGALDLAVAAVLGAAIGAFLLGTAASYRAESVPVGIALGVALGGLGGLLGSFGGLFLSGLAGLGGSRQSFIVARLIVWGLAGGLIGALLGAVAVGRDRHRPLNGFLYGLGAGVVGGLLMSLPGPTDLWQLLGFIVVGLAIGAGLTVPGLRKALGVVELEQVGGRSPGLLRHRGWEVPVDGQTRLGRSVELRVQRGRCQLVPTPGGEPVVSGGKPVSGPVELLNQDAITVGDRVFRFRRFPDAAL